MVVGFDFSVLMIVLFKCLLLNEYLDKIRSVDFFFRKWLSWLISVKYGIFWFFLYFKWEG